MDQIIDDRKEDWFKQVMEAIAHAQGDRKAVSEQISAEILLEFPTRSNGGIDAH